MTSKGPRTMVTARIPNEVYAILEDRRRHSGSSTSLSQMVSDVLALYVNRPDLAVEITQWEQQK